MCGRVGTTNGHSMNNVGQNCQGLHTLDREDFFRNWDQVYDNTRLVYLHELNNPDHKGFFICKVTTSAPPLP